LLELQERCPELLSLTEKNHRHIITHHLTDPKSRMVRVDGVRRLKKVVELRLNIRGAIVWLVWRVFTRMPFKEDLNFFLENLDNTTFFTRLDRVEEVW
jgi:hypothetical protein